MATRVIDIGGGERLAIDEVGAAGRGLLLVHGFTAGRVDFADHLDALADAGWWVVAPDLRGHGDSWHPEEESDYSFEHFAERLLAERPGYREQGDRKLLGSAPAMYASMIGQMVDQVDRLQHLADLSVPTLVIVGEQDAPFLGPSEAMAAAVPGARLEVIADAGHSPQTENPEAWRAVMLDFLAAL